MKLAVISDIHANLEAFKAALEAAGKVDGYLSAGDIVGYGPNPNECVDLVKIKKFICVAGNHDWACTGKVDQSLFAGDARLAVEWTESVLSPQSREYLDSLSDLYEGEDFEMVHGSLRDRTAEYISNVNSGAATIECMTRHICIVGHLHIPLVIVRDLDGKCDGWQLSDGDTIELSKFNKVIINCGAVGQPRDMDPRASFGIYDTEKQTIQIRRIAYDIAAVQKKMEKAGLPGFLIERLKYGR